MKFINWLIRSSIWKLSKNMMEFVWRFERFSMYCLCSVWISTFLVLPLLLFLMPLLLGNKYIDRINPFCFFSVSVFLFSVSGLFPQTISQITSRFLSLSPPYSSLLIPNLCFCKHTFPILVCICGLSSFITLDSKSIWVDLYHSLYLTFYPDIFSPSCSCLATLFFLPKK